MRTMHVLVHRVSLEHFVEKVINLLFRIVILSCEEKKMAATNPTSKNQTSVLIPTHTNRLKTKINLSLQSIVPIKNLDNFDFEGIYCFHTSILSMSSL